MAKHKRGGGKPSKRANSRRPSGSSSTALKPSGPAAVDRRIWIVIAGVAVGVLLMGMLAIGAAGGNTTPTPTPRPLAAVPAPDITPAEANQRWDAGALLLDVREQDEWDTGHVPGATHIALSDLAARVGELPADRTVLVICRSGNRSVQARDILTAAGLTATSITGGVKAWRDAGLVYQGDILEG